MVSTDSSKVSPQVLRTKTQILTVARQVLSEGGPHAATFAAIAARAGATRQTVYRHWATREALIADVVLTGPKVEYPVPNGDAKKAVRDFLTSLREGMNDQATGAALMALAAQAHQDPTSSAALVSIVEDRRQALNALLSETDRTVSADEFAQLCGPVIYQRLLARSVASDELIAETATNWHQKGTRHETG